MPLVHAPHILNDDDVIQKTILDVWIGKFQSYFCVLIFRIEYILKNIKLNYAN